MTLEAIPCEGKSGSAAAPGRTLFVLEHLPRASVSMRGLIEGREAASGSVLSSLLVVERLASRGHAVALLNLGGQALTEQSFQVFHEMAAARAWIGGGRVVWCSWGHDSTLDLLNGAGFRPLMWIHTHLEPHQLRALEGGRVNGIVTVSDCARLTSLHTSAHRRLGRVYNALSPAYVQVEESPADRYASRRVVFAGHFSVSKGVHRVLQAWLEVRRRLPEAVLTMAGSARLYGQDCGVGRLGVADAEFEQRYLEPLVSAFGSLEAGGIRLAGLLSPVELRRLYSQSSLGLVNFNWTGFTETFCCTGVEMLATGLPVFSFPRGGLPESIGRTGGAVLFKTPDLVRAAEEIVEMLQDPGRLRALGEAGRQPARTWYDLDRIADQWERILSTAPNELSKISGPWSAPRPWRYWLERAAGLTHSGALLELAFGGIRGLRG